MIHKRYISMLLVLSMVVTIFAGIPVFAVESNIPGNVFREDFNDGDANGWTTYAGGNGGNPGVWNVAQQQYSINGNPGAKAMALGTSFNDLVYEADVNVSGLNSDNSGLIFRGTNAAVGVDGYNGYFAAIRWDKKLELSKVTQNGWKSLNVSSISVTGGHLKVVAIGNVIKVYINDMNTPVIDITDSDADAITTAGCVGLRTYWGTTTFDNLEAREYYAVETAKPVFGTPEGVYNSAQTISLSSTTTGAAIRYTTDGTLPNLNSPLYSSSINLTQTATIKAYAEKQGEMVSTVVSQTYVIANLTNTFSDNFDDGDATGWTHYFGNNASSLFTEASGKFTLTNPQGDKLIPTSATSYDDFIFDADVNPGNSGDSSGVVFRSSAPGTGADNLKGYFVGMNVNGYVQVGRMNNSWTELCRIPAVVNANQENHLRIYAKGSTFYIFVNNKLVGNFTDITYATGNIGLRGWYNSGNVTWDNIQISGISKLDSVQIPSFSPTETTFTGSQQVIISSATTGASIYYTTDKSTPSASSPVYSGPITLTQTTTVKAYASLAGMLDSEVQSTTYTKNAQAYENDFNNNGTTGWNTYGGTWSASTGAYTVTNGGGFKAVAAGTDFENFTYESDVTMGTGTDGGRNTGVIFRVSNPTLGADSLNGYYAGITYSGNVQVGRFDQKWTELATIPCPIAIIPGTTYKLKVKAIGDNIDVYVNDVHVVDVVDKTYTHGAIGMRTWLTNATYDNILVTDNGAYTNPVYDWSNVKGAVFVPTNAVNEVQQWKFYDAATNDRELSYAQTYGINSIRVYLHFLNWKNDKVNLMNNLEDFLTRAAKYGIKTELVFFDDCWDEHPNWDNEVATLAPIYGVHNSRWLESPGSDIKAVYNTDASVRSDLKAYVQDIVTAHKADPRVLFWNVYNEPGNGGTLVNVTKQLMNDGRMWVKDTGSTIPVSSTGREFVGDPFSDFITWHAYDNAYPDYANGHNDKSVLIDEGMHRGRNADNQTVTGMVDNYGKKGTGFIMWEFGIGRDNCRFAWGDPYTTEVTTPFHGVVYPDGHPWNTADVKSLLGDEAFNILPVYNVNYYKDNNFTTLAKSSITPLIDFDLGDEKGTGSPDATVGIDKDNFSIRWMGHIAPTTTGKYTLYADSDNIAGIWVNNTKVVDKITNIREEASGDINLTAGQTYSIKIEYVHATGNSSLHVNWSGPSVSKQILLPIFINNPVVSVTLNTTTLNLVTDATSTLTATVNPTDASNSKVTWSSDNTAIASVDSNGIVTGKTIGSANITGTTSDGGKTATCVVIVTAAMVPQIPTGSTLDQFDSATLDSAWTIVNPETSSWSLTEKSGSLRIRSQGGDMWQTLNAHKNVFTRTAPSEDFQIITKVSSAIAMNYQQSGLIVWQDQDNYVRFGRAYDSGFGGKSFELAKEVNGAYSGSTRINQSSYPVGDNVYLKVTKVGNIYTAYFWNGIDWMQAGNTVTAVLTNAKVGLYSVASTDGTSVVEDFDYFSASQLTNNPNPSSDSTLSGIKVNGTTVSGFNAATLTYNVELVAGTTQAEVAATTTTSNARATVSPATSLPGATTVLVTAEDGTTSTYTINFTVAASTATNEFTVNSTFNMDALMAGQVLNVQTTVKNNNSTHPSVLVIVALYDGSGAMVNVSYISKNIVEGSTENLNAGFKLPSNVTNYHVKVFVWEGTSLTSNSGSPLSNVVTK